jgi:hypothetical protein
LVARQAGISAASIHNIYPDIAQAIRAKNGTSDRSALDAERLERKRLDVARIASENARLVTENSLLKARLKSHNVVSLIRRVSATGAHR